ncbi:MAG TPA: hypothetical protein VJ487_01685 [Alphaproteobacteria bacterium]|nr:hypothetical protein [Alphaproteobacteria bacterium]
MKLFAATAVGFLIILPALAQKAGLVEGEANSPPAQHALALAPQAPRTPPAQQARSPTAVQAAQGSAEATLGDRMRRSMPIDVAIAAGFLRLHARPF